MKGSERKSTVEIQGMTGYGCSEQGEFRVEVRSLNHKYCDISFKMPPVLLKHEISLRNMVRERFERGKFDVIIAFTGNQHVKVSMNRELAIELHDSFSELQQTLGMPDPPGLGFLSGFRDLLVTFESEFNADLLFRAFSEALSQVREMRLSEGRNIMADLSERFVDIEKLRDLISTIADKTVPGRAGALRKKIVEIAGSVPLDEQRISQEIALIVQKSDITEELIRIGSHLGLVRTAFAQGGTPGRKLDFICQELHREVNTIASKADNADITALTIEMRSGIEKIREQAHNLQ